MSSTGTGSAAETAPSDTPSHSPRDPLAAKVGEISLDWWAELNAVDMKSGEPLEGRKPARRAIAELRRIGAVDGPNGDEIDTAYAVSIRQDAGPQPYLDLRKRLKGMLAASRDDYARSMPERPGFDAAVAVVAATLARVREHKKGVVAKLLGAGSRDDAPLMAEARFKRLIRTTTAPDLLDQGRRIVMLLKRSAPVDDLGASLLLWNTSPYVKRRWSFAYYDAEDMNADGPGDSNPCNAAAPTNNF